LSRDIKLETLCCSSNTETFTPMAERYLEFFSDIPAESKVCAYTREQAKMLYEEHRKAVLTELGIREVQRRTTDKLLNRKSPGVDLLFYKRNVEDLGGIDDLGSGMSEVLSEEYGERPQPMRSGMNDPTGSEVKGIRDESIDSSTSKLELKPRYRGNGLGRLLDLEAEVSGECSDEELEDDGRCLDDPDFIAPSDEEYEAPTEKHNEDVLQMHKELLEKIKKRFSRRSKPRHFFGAREEERSACSLSSSEEAIDSGSEEDGIGNADDTLVFPREEEFQCAEEVKSAKLEPGAVEFLNDPRLAEKKLGEKKESFSFEPREGR
jgi:hypothetical protein